MPRLITRPVGAFDVLAEFWPNLAIILYRVHHDNHAFLVNVFLGTSLITLMGTTAETIMIMVLFGESWSRWELSFKIVTPILHIIFTMAQLHGSRILFQMYLKQKKMLAAEDQALRDLEMNPQEFDGPKKVEGEDAINKLPQSTATTEVPSEHRSNVDISPTITEESAQQSRKASKFPWPKWASKRS
jgi:hypothetical protein